MFRFTRLATLLAITSGILIAPVTNAQLTTFAQLIAPGSPFNYTSTGTAGAGGTASLDATNASAFFIYFGIANLPTDLTGLQSAHLTFTSFSTLGPTNEGTGFSQSFDGSGVNSAMLTITRDTPAAEGSGTRTILLQVIFTPFTFTGSGGSGGLSASSLTGSVTFSSDFLTFPSTVERDLGVTFSSIVPSLSIGANGFFNDFTAAGTATFSSNPVPSVIPEPSTYLLMGISLIFAAGWAVGRRRLALATPR